MTDGAACFAILAVHAVDDCEPKHYRLVQRAAGSCAGTIEIIGRSAVPNGRICALALSELVIAAQASRTEKQPMLNSNSVNRRSARCWHS
jgi:hypothetical protein